MNSTKDFVVNSKAKASKYNQRKNATNFDKPLILQQIVEQSRVNNKKKVKR
jgi:hypothetical protein